MRNNGWKNEATRIMAEWIAHSTMTDAIRDSGVEGIALAQKQMAGVERDTVVDALTNLFAERMPHVLEKRLTSLIEDGCSDDPDSFTVVLAVVGFDMVDWLQIATHWAEVITPGAFDDDASGDSPDDPLYPIGD
jgi:hypothetical protein